MSRRWWMRLSRSAASPKIWPTSSSRSTSICLWFCRAAVLRSTRCSCREPPLQKADRRLAMQDLWRTLKQWPELILEQLEDAGVARVTLNRPDKRNCLNEPLVTAWFEALEMVRADREVKAVITKGAGPCFSSGLDLNFLRKVSEEQRD